MKIWTCNNHKGLWPVPTASVVVAATEEEARALLEAALLAEGIEDLDFTLELLKTNKAIVRVLSNGDY